jgi:hypothetical protein
MFTHYNAVLRKFPASILESMKGNRYVTTVHCINSGIQKLSRATPLNPRFLFRGFSKMQVCRCEAETDGEHKEKADSACGL